MADLLKLAAEVALRKMAEQGHFSICTIDKIREASGLGRGAGDAYRTLNLLHCVDYDKMPAELRRELPALVAEVLMQPDIEFSLSGRFRTEQALEVVEPAPRKGFLRRLAGG